MQCIAICATVGLSDYSSAGSTGAGTTDADVEDDALGKSGACCYHTACETYCGADNSTDAVSVTAACAQRTGASFESMHTHTVLENNGRISSPPILISAISKFDFFLKNFVVA